MTRPSTVRVRMSRCPSQRSSRSSPERRNSSSEPAMSSGAGSRTACTREVCTTCAASIAKLSPVNDLQAYMIHEYVDDYKEGHLSRRDLIRRVLYMTGGVASTATALLA